MAIVQTVPPGDLSALETHQAARRRLLLGHEAQIARLRQTDDRRRWVDIATFGAMWLGGMLLNYLGWRIVSGPAGLGLRMVGILATALGLNAFFLMMHEGMHSLLLNSRRSNHIGSFLIGSLLCVSFTAYRVLHRWHHLYLGDERDPDDYRRFGNSRYVIWFGHIFRLTIGSYVYLFLIPAAALKRASAEERRLIFREYVLILLMLVAAIWLFSGDMLLNLWLLPMPLLTVLTGIRGISQHAFTDPTHPFLASRSIRAGKLARFLMLNENYHLEHHLFPEIPSYHLDQVYALVAPRLDKGTVAYSYTEFMTSFLKAAAHLATAPIGVYFDLRNTPSAQ